MDKFVSNNDKQPHGPWMLCTNKGLLVYYDSTAVHNIGHGLQNLSSQQTTSLTRICGFNNMQKYMHCTASSTKHRLTESKM